MALALIENKLRYFDQEIQRKIREAAEIQNEIANLTAQRELFEDKHRILEEAVKLVNQAKEKKRLMETEILAELEAPKRLRVEPSPSPVEALVPSPSGEDGQPSPSEEGKAPDGKSLPEPLPQQEPVPLKEHEPSIPRCSGGIVQTVKTPRHRSGYPAGEKRLSQEPPVDLNFPELPAEFNPAKKAAYVLHCSAAILLSNDLEDSQRIKILSDAPWLPMDLKELLAENDLTSFRSAVVARVPGEMSRLLGVVWDPSLSSEARIEAARQVSRPVARYVANRTLPSSQMIAMVCGALSAFMAHMARSTLDAPAVEPTPSQGPIGPEAVVSPTPEPKPAPTPKIKTVVASVPGPDVETELQSAHTQAKEGLPEKEPTAHVGQVTLPTPVKPGSLRLVLGGRATMVPLCSKIRLGQRCSGFSQPVIRIIQPDASSPQLDFSCIFHCDKNFEGEPVLLCWTTPVGTKHQMQVRVSVADSGDIVKNKKQFRFSYFRSVVDAKLVRLLVDWLAVQTTAGEGHGVGDNIDFAAHLDHLHRVMIVVLPGHLNLKAGPADLGRGHSGCVGVGRHRAEVAVLPDHRLDAVGQDCGRRVRLADNQAEVAVGTACQCCCLPQLHVGGREARVNCHRDRGRLSAVNKRVVVAGPRQVVQHSVVEGTQGLAHVYVGRGQTVFGIGEHSQVSLANILQALVVSQKNEANTTRSQTFMKNWGESGRKNSSPQAVMMSLGIVRRSRYDQGSTTAASSKK
jgi:hypothetical protein